jgi:hypothetical protein
MTNTQTDQANIPTRVSLGEFPQNAAFEAVRALAHAGIAADLKSSKNPDGFVYDVEISATDLERALKIV